MKAAEKLITSYFIRSCKILKNLLLLTHNSELNLAAYRQLGINIFTEESITPQDYASIEIMLGWKPDISQKILTVSNSSLKWLQTISAGVDYLPLKTLKEKQVIVSNVSGVHAEPISQTVLLYALYFMRDLPQVLESSAQHHWEPQADFGDAFVLSETTWTIFGTGHIGSELARLLQAFHAKTIGVNRTGHKAAHFDDTFAQDDWRHAVAKSDVLVNIMPLTPQTTHFFDKTFFNALHNTYLFINVGRGKSVDTAALIDALNQQKLQHAALDVFEEEPLPSDNALWQMKNVLITPHYSAQTKHQGQAWDKIFLPNLKQFMRDGTVPINQINMQNGY